MGTPAISTFNAGSGTTEVGEVIFKTAVTSILEFFGAEVKSLAAVREMCQLAHAQFHWLHFAELKHFAMQAKQGRFNTKESYSTRDLDGYITGKEEWDGKMYGPLTPALLLKWLDRYASESIASRALVYGDARPVTPAPDPDAVYVDPAKVAEALTQACHWRDALMAIPDPAKPADEAEQERRRQERIARRRAEFLGTVSEPEPAQPSPPPVSSASAAELELAIWDFCDRIQAGEPTNTLDDLQFYRNHKAAIEAELKDRQNQTQA